MKIANNITEVVGKTPLVRLSKIAANLGVDLVAKLEFFNPCASVKDRVGLALILDAESKGLINKDTTIIEASSGNTGIGLAFVCSQRGYKLVLVMPKDVSRERKKLLTLFGAQIVLTPKSKGMAGAVRRAEQLKEQTPNSFIARQFSNPANPGVHRQTTAVELWQDTDGEIDIFVAGVGTGGTITGAGQELKKRSPKVNVVAVEPAKSAVLSGKRPGSHKIAGIGAGFIPEVLNREVIDEVITVSDKEAFATMKKIIKEEGIALGVSSGAVAAAALRVAQREENKGKRIVVIFADSAERYLSVL
ncbi:MAG: cysteine synthase A [Candidatus Omnitrophota bacterium]|nr:MAG: cysteine synthase A [Candidatus Omnitrophota bacterium]